MQASKSSIRKLFRERRNALNLLEYDSFNQALLQSFITLNFDQVAYIHFFLPIIENNEPNTFLMIDWLKTNSPDITIVISKTDYHTLTTSYFVLDENTQLTKNSYGILEPTNGNPISPLIIDQIFIPLLAYDNFGNRIGYGKGIYDRMLLDCRKDVEKIGLSFFEPYPERISCQEWDIKLNYCLSPNRIFSF